MIDITNSFFVWGGAIVTWLNIWRLIQDKECKGVSIAAQVFFMAWAVWNVVFYACQGLSWSLIASVVHAIGAIVWVETYIKFQLTTPTNSNNIDT